MRNDPVVVDHTGWRSVSEQVQVIWEPSAERIERATLTRYTRWLEETRGLAFASYAELWQWSVDDLESFWASIWEFCGIRCIGAVRARARFVRHARRTLVPRRAAQLRRARLPRPRRRATSRSCTPPSATSRPSCPGASWSGRPRGSPPVCVRSESGPATGWSHTCRTSPRRSPPFSRARRWARSGRAARPTSACARSSTASRRSSRRCCSPSTATATAAVNSIAVRCSQRLQDEIPSLEHTVVLGRLDTAPDLGGLRAALSWERSPGTRARRRADLRRSCPSTTPCGCSTAPAPRGCRRRSCTATAASCSSSRST